MIWGEKRKYLRMLFNQKTRLSAFSISKLLRNQLTEVFGTGASVWLGDGLCVHRGESKCILRRHGQLSGEAQAEEGGWKGRDLGGQETSEGQRGWVLGGLGFL